MRLVIDCSVSVAWIFKDERSPYTQALLAEIGGYDVFVPEIWRLEVANALLIGEKAGRMTTREVDTGLYFLRGLLITTDSATQDAAWEDTLWLARKHRLTSYDAAYLELALRHDAVLATLDKQLIKAAHMSDVKIFAP